MLQLSSFFSALFLTILIELIISVFFGFRTKIEIATIILINVITNPILNYLLLLNAYFSFIKAGLILLLFLELIIILTEWRLMCLILKNNPKKMLALSIVMNFFSFAAGIIIFKILNI